MAGPRVAQLVQLYKLEAGRPGIDSGADSK
jgi:hypothetical protein